MSYHPLHYQYARRCAELDYMISEIKFEQVPDKTDWYKRVKFELLRDILTEKIIRYANTQTRVMRTQSEIDEVRLKKSYQVNWVNNRHSQMSKTFGRKKEAENFAKELRNSFKLIDIVSREKVVIKALWI